MLIISYWVTDTLQLDFKEENDCIKEIRIASSGILLKTSQSSNLINYHFGDTFKGMPVGYELFHLSLISKFVRSKIYK